VFSAGAGRQAGSSRPGKTQCRDVCLIYVISIMSENVKIFEVGRSSNSIVRAEAYGPRSVVLSKFHF